MNVRSGICGKAVRQCAWTMVAACIGLGAAPAPAVAGGDADQIWSALRQGGHAALLRHAIAPGIGDPPEFSLGECSTQRNLSDKGRRQAQRIGDRFRENGIADARVYSSQWCRCMETARLLDLGPVKALESLNSFFRDYARRGPQTNALGKWLSQQDLSAPLVLITHQVNITAYTGVYPESGELVVVRFEPDGQISVVGTVVTD